MTQQTHRRMLGVFAVMLAATIGIGGAAEAETIRIAVKGLAFVPAQIAAHVGDTIVWANDDFVAHTATARNGAWDVQLPPHATGQTVIQSPGTIAYYCRYHPNMKGEITAAPQ